MEVDEGAVCQPNSAAVQGRGTGMNLDVFDKQRRDKSVPQPPENGLTSPVPPERRKYRANANLATNKPNVPNLSILNAIEKGTSSEQIQQSQNIPNVSLLNGSLSDVLSIASTTTTATSVTSSKATLDASSANDSTSNGSYSVDSATTTKTRTAAGTTPNVPLITLLIENSTGEIVTTSSASDSRTKKSAATATTSLPDESAISYNNLPAISALNLNTASGDNGLVPHAGNVDTNSLDDGDEENYEDDDVEDDDEDADVSLRNLSNSEHQTSNNDSSLTTVTGTSGENSFELTNDSSSASNDDSNIPNLSELQKDL